jgi:hypothetical protein
MTVMVDFLRVRTGDVVSDSGVSATDALGGARAVAADAVERLGAGVRGGVHGLSWVMPIVRLHIDVDTFIRRA